MRLIDADAFEQHMQNKWENNEISNGEWIHFREMLNQEQTIDAVEVVRCKECVNWDDDWDPVTWGAGYHYCTMMDTFTTADEFCRRGEQEG